MSNDGVLSGAARIIDQFIKPIQILRGPLIASVIGFIGLSAPDQTIEIYRALTLDYQVMRPQIILAIGTLILASIVIWYIGRNATLRWQSENIQSKSIAGILLRWLPRLFGALPLIGAGVGLLKAARRFDSVELEPFIEAHGPFIKAQMPDVHPSLVAASKQFDVAETYLTYAGYGLFALAFLFVVVWFFWARNRFHKFENPNRFLFGRTVPLLILFVVVVATIGFCIFYYIKPVAAVELAVMIGSLAIFNIFVIWVAFSLGFLVLIHQQTRFPAISVLLLIAFVSTALNLNDNHEVRKLKPNVEEQDSVSVALTRWVKQRPDRAYYQTKKYPYIDALNLSAERRDREIEERRQYPIYVIAAQGGGIYAAHQTALALARIQDRCPAFAQHIFAISGVSGGSLGAALFSALVKFRTKNAAPITDPSCLERTGGLAEPGWYEKRVDKFMSSDFLSPLVAAGLFPDFLQRFLPFSIAEFDRARAFELSIERAWRLAVPEDDKNVFGRSFYGLWKPDGIVPALVLNSVEVHSGARRVVSPFAFKGRMNNSLETLRPILGHNIALSTAVGLSARFPWLLPAATITSAKDRQYRLVDGGIYEYSGAATALGIAEYAKGHLNYVNTVHRRTGDLWAANVRVQMLVISDDEILEDATQPRNDEARSLARKGGYSQRKATSKGGLRIRDDSESNVRQGFGELMSPVRSLLNSRIERAADWVIRAFSVFCTHCYKSGEYNWNAMPFPGFHGAVGLYRLNHTDYNFTLGWQLSQATRQIISAHSGYAHNCKAAISEIYNGWPWAGLVYNQNNCAACRVEHDLETSWLTLVGRLRRNIKFGTGKTIVTLCRGDDLANPDLSGPPVVQPGPISPVTP